MKKVLAILAVAALALALVACGGSELGVYVDDDGVHAKAIGAAEGSGTGTLTISQGYGLCINHIVEKGIFHIKATGADGTIVFDEDVTDNIADLVDVQPGDYDLMITAKNATGTIDVIPYDKKAQAMADATLSDALEQNGVNAEELGLSNSSDSSKSN